MIAQSIVRALRGHWHGSYGMAKCVSHDDGKTPSLQIKNDPRKSDGIDVHCYAGCDWQAIKAALCSHGLLDEFSPEHRPRGTQPRQPIAIVEPELKPDSGERTAYALRQWDGCASGIRNTPAWQHLINRKIDVDQMPPELHRVLRWHPACPWEQGRHGCMLALFTDAVTGEPKAIHRTAITPTGEKIDRKALGPISGCVIRLWPDEAVTEGLVIGEGIETTLAAATRMKCHETLLQPAWATGFAGNMAAFPVLSGIEALTLLVDKDAGSAGEDAAIKCARRWTAAGREVIRLVPRQVGEDFNDIVTKSISS